MPVASEMICGNIVHVIGNVAAELAAERRHEAAGADGVVDVVHRLVPVDDVAGRLIGNIAALLPLQEVFLELLVGHGFPLADELFSLLLGWAAGSCGNEPSIWVMLIFSPVAIMRK